MKSETLIFLAMFSLFSVLYLMGTYYVFNSIGKIFLIKSQKIFNFIGLALGLLSFIFLFFRFCPYKIIYYASAYFFGIIFISASVFICFDIIKKAFSINHSFFDFVLILTTLVLIIYAILNPLLFLKIKNIKIESKKIKEPLKLVLIADTHIHKFSNPKYLQKIVKIINEKNPKIVLIAGDFVDGGLSSKLIEPVDEISSPVFLSMGNHEFYHNKNRTVEKLIKTTKIQVLDTQTIKINNITVSGVPFKGKNISLEEELKSIDIDKDNYNIFLYHEPSYIPIIEKKGFDLMLSGHTHGGQIIPWNFITNLFYKYFKGLYCYENMQIYVSQGTGVWGPPMRLGSYNEITVIDIK